MDRTLYIKRSVKAAMAFAFLILIFTASVRVKAEETVEVTGIDYEKSTVTVKLGTGDTELQISDSKQKTWETVTVEPVSGAVTLDISWIPVSKDYVLSLRGDKNKTAVKVKIPKQEKTLKVTYTAAAGVLDITGDNGRTIQWRKKNSTKWKTYNKTAFSKTLEGLVSKGATLVFRTAPVKGDGTSAGLRPGKEVSVAIKHKTAAPKVAIDNEKLTFKLDKGLEYRFCDEDGKVLDGEKWKKVPVGSDVLIKDLAPKALADASKDGETVGIQFRVPATAKKQMSNTTTVFIPGQTRLTDEELKSVKIEYKEDGSGFMLTFEKASYSVPYEYCIINAKDQKEGVTIDSFNEIHWVTVTDKRAFTVEKEKNNATEGSIIYVRKKSIRKLGISGYALASTYKKFTTVEY